jgi:hypothetical protein
MGAKMLSAAGLKNIRAVKVRKDASRESPTRNTVNDREEQEVEEKTVNHSNESKGRLLNSERRSRVPNLRPSINTERIRGGIGEMKQKSRNGVETLKVKSRNGADTIKKKGRSGVDLMRNTGSSIVTKRPSIRLMKKKEPSALPSRSLFQHTPRTWFGGRVDKGEKVKEDWRNSRPPPNGFKRSSTVESGDRAPIKRSSKVESGSSSPLNQERPVARSRSGHRKAPFDEDVARPNVVQEMW